MRTVILLIFLVFLGSIFTNTRVTVLSVGRTGVERLTRRKSRQTRVLVGLARRPTRFVATVHIAMAATKFLRDTFTTRCFTRPVARTLVGAKVSMPRGILGVMYVVVIAVLLSCMDLLFKRLIPEHLKVGGPSRLSLHLTKLLGVTVVTI